VHLTNKSLALDFGSATSAATFGHFGAFCELGVTTVGVLVER